MSEYAYDRGAILLVAYRVIGYAAKIIPCFHSDIRFASLDEIGGFQFAPADLPLIAEIKQKSTTKRKETAIFFIDY